MQADEDRPMIAAKTAVRLAEALLIAGITSVMSAVATGYVSEKVLSERIANVQGQVREIKEDMKDLRSLVTQNLIEQRR